jgi:hypothetical protein
MAYNNYVVLSSATKHGVAMDDAVAAAENAAVIFDLAEGTDPHCEMRLGWDRWGQLLEVGILPEAHVIFHAMLCRKAYRRRFHL